MYNPAPGRKARCSIGLLTAAAFTAGAVGNAHAEDSQATNRVIEEVIVTGVPHGGATRLEASVSVSSLPAEDAAMVAPRSVAEIFRSLPGIRAESSGGGGNANLTIRGIPLATGGSKYMQIHEDGLPVLEYGDINFANTDNFIRFDSSIDRIESIRGGSASTFASNSPGGIINLISKTGGEDTGSFGVSFGADYDEFRTDFEYGGALGDRITYHVGGFFRDGEGVRDIGYKGDNGGQVKANITFELDNGFLRLYAKRLDDKVATYLPSPVMVDGSGEYDSVPGYDASSEGTQSAATNDITTFDAFGNPRSRSVSDGIESKVSAFGFEFDQEVGESLYLNNKFRISTVEGGFISPFTDGFAGGTATVASKGASLCATASVGGVNIDCSAGVTATINGAAANPNQLAFTNLLFDTEFNDVGLMVNDLSLTKEFDRMTISGGIYWSKQSIDINWNSWHARTQTLDGGNAQNITYVATNAGIDADGNPVDVQLTDGGALSQSFLSWDWDLEYTTIAPYLNIGFQVTDDITIDASVRRDDVEARGTRLDGCCGGNTAVDLNGNGSVGQFTVDPMGNITRLDSDALLENPGASSDFIAGGVRVLNETSSARTRVDYDADNVSYSIGGTWVFADSTSVFVRYSDGGRAVADRLTQVAGGLNSDGSLASTTDGYDNVTQLEVGTKHQADNWSLYATLFSTEVEETNSEITSGLTFVRDYTATGIEFEGDYDFNDAFRIRGNMTWSDAEIDKDQTNPAVEGNTPRRQADFIWTITPEYRHERFVVGATLQGSTEFYVQDNNDLKQDAYNLIHLFGAWNITDALTASINVNNLTDEFVITESEEGSGNPGDIIRARPLSGRSTSVGLTYRF